MVKETKRFRNILVKKCNNTGQLKTSRADAVPDITFAVNICL